MFLKAKPVWLRDKEKEMNLTAVFTQKTGDLKETELYITAASFYRLFINGKFVAFGPARTARGYARVDILPLSAYGNGGENELRIEVAAYNCRSLSTCKSEGFLCAELRRGDRILAATGLDFTSAVLTAKAQYAERYSIQRHFGEVWDLTQSALPCPMARCEQTPIFLPRVAPYPHYEDIMAAAAMGTGRLTDTGTDPEKPNRYSWKVIPAYWGRFEENEVPRKPFRWILRQEQHPASRNVPLPLTLQAGEYAVFDLQAVQCGFLQLAAESKAGADIVIGFSEYAEGETFSFTPMNAQNVLEYILPTDYKGEEMSFEPYTLRFAVVMVKSGALTLSAFGVKTFERDMTGARIPSFPTEMQKSIYQAALRTFAHNAVDLYSDCPSRERAGWLCDSYFTGVAEHHFFGAVPVEDAFLENHRLCNEPVLARGMLAMCYPADVKKEDSGLGHHIPQWSMWYVLEVAEYLTTRNKTVDKELYRHSVEGVVGYLQMFENSDGLLEDLPSWNFVEWSDANKWTQNVNYPTNFLYAAVLQAAGALYGHSDWVKRAAEVQERTKALSFDGELFTDNAVRGEDGALRNTGNTSEAGQYYALLFGNIDLDDPYYAKLKAHVLSGCKGVAESGRRFVPVNAFIGLYLRMKTLLELGQYRLLLDEVEYFFGGMADKTGTLWEYREMKGSFDHGFASYAAYAMCTALEHLQA